MPIPQQNWRQFSPGSPNYYGAQGIGIPPWMQQQFDGASGATQETATPQVPYQSGTQTGGRGSMEWPGASPGGNVEPQWFTDFKNEQAQMQGYGGYPTQSASVQQPPTTQRVAPTEAPINTSGSAPVTGSGPPAAPTSDARTIYPGTPEWDYLSQFKPVGQTVTDEGPAAPPQTAPVAHTNSANIVTPPPPLPAPPEGAPPTPPAPTAATSSHFGPSVWSPGMGEATWNGWYMDPKVPGGWAYGKQSAQDQYNIQYPQQPQPQPAATPSPTPTPTPVPVQDMSRIPEALGGTMSNEDVIAERNTNIDLTRAGFGNGVPEAMGGRSQVRTYARGGAVRGMGRGMMMHMDSSHPMGLVHAARQLEMYGDGPDTSLAHISPDESAMLDYLQGGRRMNTATGLPQYSLFGDILKAVARIAATTVGFMYGGPLGAAAGSAAATKLTGGSWKDAAISGGLSGLTAGIGNIAGGNAAFASGNSLANSTIGQQVFEGAAPGAVGAGAATPGIGQVLSNAVKYAGTTPGLALAGQAGLGAFSKPSSTSSPPPGWQGPNTAPPYVPDMNRLPSWYLASPAKKAAQQETASDSGDNGIIDPNDPEYASKMSLRYAGAQQFADGGQVGLGASPQDILQAANWGYVNAQRGGRIHGPGTGTSDSIPSLLSDGEHVIDRQTVDDAAKLVGRPGDNDAGQEAVEKIKQTIRRAAGRRNPRSPTSPMKAA